MSQNKKTLLIFAIMFLLFLLVEFLFPLRAPSQEQPRAQVLLVYDHKQAGKYIVEVKARPILMLRQDDPEAHLAPIEPGTLMLCRPYTEGSHLMFRCGQDKFVMEALDFQPEK